MIVKSKYELLVVIVFIFISILPYLKITGNATMNVILSITPEAEIFSPPGIVKFGIDLDQNSNYSVYNGSLNASSFFTGGFDPDNLSINETEAPFVTSYSSTNIDVTVKASNLIDSEDMNNIIYTNSELDNFQAYIPGIGWKNIPNLNDNNELCIVDNMTITNSIMYYDLRIKSKNTANGRYYTNFIVTPYDTEQYNVCDSIGKYVIP